MGLIGYLGAGGSYERIGSRIATWWLVKTTSRLMSERVRQFASHRHTRYLWPT